MTRPIVGVSHRERLNPSRQRLTSCRRLRGVMLLRRCRRIFRRSRSTELRAPDQHVSAEPHAMSRIIVPRNRGRGRPDGGFEKPSSPSFGRISAGLPSLQLVPDPMTGHTMAARWRLHGLPRFWCLHRAAKRAAEISSSAPAVASVGTFSVMGPPARFLLRRRSNGTAGARHRPPPRGSDARAERPVRRRSR